MNLQEIQNKIAELENSALKLLIDNKIVYVTNWQYIGNNQMVFDYICFHKESESYEFYQKVQNALIELYQKETENRKWYKMLFLKICAPIRFMREKFGLS